MAQTVDVQAAKMYLSQILDRVERGEEVIIVRAGRPIARLIPLEPVERPLGFVQATLDEAFFNPLPDDELRVWESGERP